MSPPSGLEAALSALEDPAAKARELVRLHRSWAHTRQVSEHVRGVVARSWQRQTPEGDRVSAPISDHDLDVRRERSRRLQSVVPLLKERLLPLANEAGNELIISDAEGYPLWMFGPRPVRRQSDGLGFVEGALRRQRRRYQIARHGHGGAAAVTDLRAGTRVRRNDSETSSRMEREL